VLQVSGPWSRSAAGTLDASVHALTNQAVGVNLRGDFARTFTNATINCNIFIFYKIASILREVLVVSPEKS
jgi:hypothetical protein